MMRFWNSASVAARAMLRRVSPQRGIGDTVLHHQVRKYNADRVVWGRVPPEHWEHLQVIDSPLSEHAHRTAAAVVSIAPSRPRKLDEMRWNWAYEKTKASAIGTASKASPAPM